MYTRRTNTEALYITPTSTPVKRRYAQHYSLPRDPDLDTSRSTNDIPQRRLPRKPARLPSSQSESSNDTKSRYNHPVEFIVHMICQTLYQYLYLNLPLVIGDTPFLGICRAFTYLSSLMGSLATLLNFGFSALLNLSVCLMDLTRYLWMLDWSGVALHCLISLRYHVTPSHFDHPTATSTPPQFKESSSPVTSAPYNTDRLPSPLSLRQSGHTGIGSTPRPGLMTPPLTNAARSLGSATNSCLGHRADELHRILADCSETQLEAAGRLVRVLQARANARSGWKI